MTALEMASLPDELLDEFFFFCDIETLGRISCTAKFLRGDRVWLQLRTWNISWKVPAPVQKKLFATFTSPKSKLVNIKGRRIGPIDAAANAVLELVSKIGPRIESFSASHVGYAMMGGPTNQQFAQQCWEHLNPSVIRKITFTETFPNDEIALRLFRKGCPRLEKIVLTWSARSVNGLGDVLNKAEFAQLRRVHLKGWDSDYSDIIKFIRKNSDKIELVEIPIQPDLFWEEMPPQWVGDRIKSSTPLDLKALNAACISETGVSIDKVITRSRSGSLLGAYIWRLMSTLKSTVEAGQLSEFTDFFKKCFDERYPCQNSYYALSSMGSLVIKAQGADKSFVSGAVEWMIPLVLDHKEVVDDLHLWCDLYHACAYHGLDAVAAKCFVPLESQIASIPMRFSLFDFSYTQKSMMRILQQPTDWIRRNLILNQPGQIDRLLRLMEDGSPAFVVFLQSDLFDPNLPCNKRSNKATILHVLIESFKIGELSLVGQSLLNRIETFDPKLTKLQPITQFYMLRRIFSDDNLVSLYRRAVVDWRLLFTLEAIKGVPNAQMASKIIEFIGLYPNKLSDAEKTQIFEDAWRNTLTGSFKEEQLTTNVKYFLKYFPGKGVPKFIKDSLADQGSLFRVGTSKVPLNRKIVEKVLKEHFVENQQEGCRIS